ncbi:hypothetical protein BKA67DRAFT_355751 [Truncatella angustata]|uniref:Uncharacterized protein n=1 Tax=Truncatella angustata TaxID=152316 RepID=A0A9P8UI31_9PEZI|nr:uncharacterized protein BKA67DRAFT_355751 [Truncatella angustata]KAH6652422.1 hypothetical protein BKA67DRAFT_355751 [Truncatella angustata]
MAPRLSAESPRKMAPILPSSLHNIFKNLCTLAGLSNQLRCNATRKTQFQKERRGDVIDSPPGPALNRQT